MDQPNRNPDFDVPALRARLNMSQRLFAWAFGFPVATLRHWERGNRRPTGTALVLLHAIDENPRVVRDAVRKARRRNPGAFGRMEPRKTSRASPGMATD